MPLLDIIREEKLIQLARERYDPNLSDAELKVLRDSASSEDPPVPDNNAPRPEVRADFLRWLATDPEATMHIDPKGIRVYAATIPGMLNLQECLVRSTLCFFNCKFLEIINFYSADMRSIYFFDSLLYGGIFADGVKIHGALFLRSIQSEGEIRLLGARIDHDIDCSDAKLVVKGIAFGMDGAKIGGYIFLVNGFESEGEIRLVGAEIGGDLVFRGGKVTEVYCQNIIVKGDLIWQGIKKPENTYFTLVGANVKNFRDDLESWPNKENIILDGLVYEELTLHEHSSENNIKASRLSPELPLDARERIKWLMLQQEDRRAEAQPWMQLSKHLESKGDRKGAKHVVFKYRCLQAQESWLLRRWWRMFFAWMEENPLRIGWTIFGTLVLGTLVFAGAMRSGAMIETAQIQSKQDESIKFISAHYPSFQPIIYTLENAVPLVKLGIDERWIPDVQHKPQPWFPQIGWLDGLKWFNSYGFLVWFRWFLIVWGWVQATIFAAAVADRFKK